MPKSSSARLTGEVLEEALIGVVLRVNCLLCRDSDGSAVERTGTGVYSTVDLTMGGGGEVSIGSRLRETGAIWSAADEASSVLALMARIRELERTALFPVEG